MASSTSYAGSTPGTPGLAYTESVGGYDGAYSPTSTTLSIPAGAPAFAGTTYTTTYTYNVDETKARQADPAEGGLPAETLRFSYTGNGELSGIYGLRSILAGTIYTAIGQVSEFETDSTTGSFEAFGYDEATGLLNNVNTTILTGSTFTDVANTDYTRDDAGNVTSAMDAVSGESQCYSYDHLSELTQAWTPGGGSSCSSTPSMSTVGGPAPYWQTYTYDTTTGNRLTRALHATTTGASDTTESYAYPTAASAHPHAVQSVAASGGSSGTESYGYDADGSTTSRPGDAITYDPTGKPNSIVTSAGTQQDVYDASGNLLLSVGPVSGATLYNGDTELHQAQGSSQVSAIRTYTGANNIPVAERDTVAGQSGNTLYWLFTDVDGTPVTQVNSATGALTRRYTDPFGNTVGTAPAGWADDHGFLNKVTDTDTGLTLVGARDYDPTLGRFITVDPILAPSNPSQNNGYTYASNNPITNTDPSGECYVGSSDSLNFHTRCSSGQTNGEGHAPTITYGNVAAPGPDHGHVQHLAAGMTGTPHNSIKELDTCAVIEGWGCTPPPVSPKVSHSEPMIPGDIDERDSLIPLSFAGGNGSDNGTGSCVAVEGRIMIGAQVSLCSITTTDGKAHTTIELGMDVGPGETTAVEFRSVQTNAKDLAELGGLDYGLSGNLAAVGGIGAGKSWALDKPTLSTNEVGFLLGQGASVTAGFTYTVAW